MNDVQGHILIIEDDASIRRSLKATLTAMGYQVGDSSTGEEGLSSLRSRSYDAVLMDLNMPGMGGIEACRRVRKDFPQLSIIVVTVRDSEESKIEALDAGADDYVTKPFRIGELSARIRAGVRRGHTPQSTSEHLIHLGMFELDPGRRTFRKNGEEIRLTPTEFDLLAYLMTHAGHPVMHTKLLSAVWGSEYGDEREYLRTFILQLRRKLEDDPSHPSYIKTVNYLGYMFVDPAYEPPSYPFFNKAP